MSRPAVWVVVDWRNLHGQLEEAGFVPVVPTREDLTEVLDCYGFDLAGVSMGIALAYKASGQLAQLHQTNLHLANTARSYGYEVLEGELRSEDGRITEKMTDVHCALKVAELAHEQPRRCDAVLVVSRDLDMVPAVKIAGAWGMTVYLGSADPNDRRPAPRLLLTRSALQSLAGKSATIDGSRSVENVQFLLDPGPHTWTVTGRVQVFSHEGWELEHPDGWIGFVPDDAVGDVAVGAELVLVTSDVMFDGANMPLAYASPEVDLVPRQYLVEATITQRRDPAKVEVRIDNTTVPMRCPAGHAEPGQRVLVRLKRSNDPMNQQANVRMVGPLTPIPQRDIDSGRLVVGRPVLVQIKHAVHHGKVVGVTLGGLEVQLARSNFAPNPVPGHWHVAAARAVRVRGNPKLEVYDIISTRLDT